MTETASPTTGSVPFPRSEMQIKLRSLCRLGSAVATLIQHAEPTTMALSGALPTPSTARRSVVDITVGTDGPTGPLPLS
jgi:hypothetical protein